jgi:peptidyl-prolyl cis-trans isomerase B (cyclophilin B)
MTVVVASLVMAFSVLVPSKMWYAPDQAIEVRIEAEQPVRLVLTRFEGAALDPAGEARVEAGAQVNLRQVYPQVNEAGTYVLYAVPENGDLEQFVGTPLVIGVREDRRRGAPPGPMVVKVEPLRYATMHTEHGPLTMVFYYDDAPNTADNFLTLGEQGFFDGLVFHRIVPGFVIQGGDPRGDGTGGPGYQIQAEFNDRPHLEGVLSMARQGDPQEAGGAMPRPEFANSAGSQFFVCLDYAATRQLDRRYTAFGRVVEGMEAVRQIADTPIADQRTGRPRTPQAIQRVEVRLVDAQNNPYRLLEQQRPAPAAE